MHRAVSVHVAVAIAAVLVVSASAQVVELPPAPTDAATAQRDFDKRAAAITRFHACGREADYSKFRAELERGEFQSQKEDLTSILVAKIAFLTDPRHANEPSCEQSPFRVSRELMRLQVNEGIRAMRKHGRMGSEDVPCAEIMKIPEGDFDVVVRDAVRMLYMGTQPGRRVLDPETELHLYKHVLAARGGLSSPNIPTMTDCIEPAGDELGSPEDWADQEYWGNEFADGLGDFFEWLFLFLWRLLLGLTKLIHGLAVAPFYLMITGEAGPVLAAINPVVEPSVQETENHRLMIESSKYLTNGKMIRYLQSVKHDNVPELLEKQDEVRTWLLEELQRITIEDFREYNSRPYTRYSLTSIQNLYDFSFGDPEMKTASRIVLDLSAAKFAAGSNRGRRVVPFRRLADANTHSLYEFVSTADHEVVRAVTLYGQTQFLGRIKGADTQSMIYDAVSSYRPPPAVVQVAVERKGPFSQNVQHAAVEGYFSSPAFTMSLGGVRMPAYISFYGQERATDQGVAVPTVLIPTAGGTTMDDVYAFNGFGTGDSRSENLCGWKGFICGTAPHLSRRFECGTSTVPGAPDIVFVSSARCAGIAPPHFYLAHRRFPCRLQPQICSIFPRPDDPEHYGFMEMVEAPSVRDDADFQRFIAGRFWQLQLPVPDVQGIGTYTTSAGDVIRYQIGWNMATIMEVNGFPRPNWGTRGDVITSDGAGKVMIRSPWSTSRVDIDFTDWKLPRRIEVP